VPPRRRKNVTAQTLIGEGGVALIARRVNEMGYLYHDRRVDHGIDGEIELVSPNGDALNLVIMVQSKASNRPHTFETAESFQWTADPADLDYWLGGNAPVIVVLSRPADDLAWWFDVRAEFSDPRRRAERTVTINKHTQSFSPGVVLSQPPTSTAPSAGYDRSNSSSPSPANSGTAWLSVSGTAPTTTSPAVRPGIRRLTKFPA
jgi:hypothetical protein